MLVGQTWMHARATHDGETRWQHTMAHVTGKPQKKVFMFPAGSSAGVCNTLSIQTQTTQTTRKSTKGKEYTLLPSRTAEAEAAKGGELTPASNALERRDTS